MDALAIRQWLAALDAISYYDLFRIPQSASFDDLRQAFHAFAESFHPDVHRWRHPNEQAAIGIIYKRGTEAYRVLSDPALRIRYNSALASGILRPEDLIVESEGAGAKSLANPNAPGARLVDKLRSPGARPFVLRAEELYKKGDPKQAKVQLVMALHMEKGNPALDAFAKELDDAIAKKAEDDKKSWQKK
jgi:curved DNA-binding protein CbpA